MAMRLRSNRELVKAEQMLLQELLKDVEVTPTMHFGVGGASHRPLEQVVPKGTTALAWVLQPRVNGRSKSHLLHFTLTLAYTNGEPTKVRHRKWSAAAKNRLSAWHKEQWTKQTRTNLPHPRKVGNVTAA